jgi:lipopolysaccharide heptosyltransferase II
VYFDLLRRGSGAALDYVEPKLFLDEDDIEDGLSLLQPFGVDEDDRYAVIAFRAVAESRRWGEENYTELSRRLVEDSKLKIVLIGSDSDRKIGDEIAARAVEDDGSVVNLAGKSSLRELAAICSRATVFVGNDSGPAHLAAAVGAPLVVLSGADDPKETSPISNTKCLLYLDHLECISCVKNKCPFKADDFMRCMKEISVDMVLDRARARSGS